MPPKAEKKESKKHLRGKREDGGKPGSINRKGRENWVQKSWSFAGLVGYEPETTLKAENFVNGYRYVLQRLTNTAGVCVSLGSEMVMNSKGELRVSLNQGKANEFARLAVPGSVVTENKKSSFVHLKAEWERLNAEFMHLDPYPFCFRSSIWDRAIAFVKKALTTKDPKLGVPRGKLHASMKRDVPYLRNAKLPIPGYETLRNMYPFKQNEGEDPVTTKTFDAVEDEKETAEDRETQTLGFLLSIQPNVDPLRLIARGSYLVEAKGKVTTDKPGGDKIEFKKKGKKKFTLKQKKLDGMSEYVLRKLISGEWVYQCGNLRINRKGRLVLDVSFIRPPRHKRKNKNTRKAYLCIKRVPGVGKQAGLEYLFHVAVAKLSSKVDKADKWRTHSFSVNYLLHRVRGNRKKENRLALYRQSNPNWYSKDAKRVDAERKACSEKRTRIMKEECWILAKAIARKIDSWDCGHLHLSALPVEKSPEHKIAGEEPFPWADFDKKVIEKCAEYVITPSTPHSRAEAHKALKKEKEKPIWDKVNALGLKKPTPELMAELDEVRAELDKKKEEDEAVDSTRLDELIASITKHIEEMGKKDEEKEKEKEKEKENDGSKVSQAAG